MDHLTRSLGNGLVHAAIERASELRARDRELELLLSQPDTRIIPVSQARNFVVKDDAPAAWLAARDLPPEDDDLVVFLGMVNGRACFALDLEPADPRVAELTNRGEFLELRTVGPMLEDREASLLSYARGICYWHRRHMFCGACGSRTVAAQGGHVRRCTGPDCGISHFPRIDPAIIVLVHSGERCLLGRKPEWPAGRYSTIAGFVEPGEAIEQAVVREVGEETGVHVEDVSYHSSQPWPFPGSVMLGFHARGDAEREIKLVDGELEDAQWFTRPDVGRALEKTGPLRLPPGFSIARRLIEDWYRDDGP